MICRHPRARKGWPHQEGKERLLPRHSNPPVTSVSFYMPKFLHKNEWGRELHQCCNSATKSYGHAPWFLPARDGRRQAIGHWGFHPCPQEGSKGERQFLSSSVSLSLEVLLGTAAVYLLSAWACRHHWEKEWEMPGTWALEDIAESLIPPTLGAGFLPCFLLCEMTSFIIFLAYWSWDICYYG